MSFFTYSRNQADRRLWKWVHQQLTLPASESPRVKILERIIAHYAEEIGGHFEPGVYRFATQIVPLLFNWLLNSWIQNCRLKVKVNSSINYRKKEPSY